MLGWSLLRARPEVAAYCNRTTRRPPAGTIGAIDLDDEAAVIELFSRICPRMIVQCAGVCDVESCERDPAFAWAVNVDAMRILIAHAPPDARIVYCSSDHVFSGDTGPYDETSATDPLSVYGLTRVAAEQLMLARPNTVIVRSGPWIRDRRALGAPAPARSPRSSSGPRRARHGAPRFPGRHLAAGRASPPGAGLALNPIRTLSVQLYE